MKRRLFILIIVAVVLLACIVAILILPGHNKEPFVPVNIKVGDYVTFGTYFGEPILWKCVDTENGVTLLSEYIICLKPYDAAESGIWGEKGGSFSKNVNEQQYGSRTWKKSNLREWLNSADAVVKYTTQPPVESAILGGNNAYADEPGFLTNFTEAEHNLLKPVSHDKCTDLVYILSCDDVHKYICDGDPRDKDSIRMLTDAAKANCPHDDSFDPGNDWWYFTRSPIDTDPNGKNMTPYGGGAFYYYNHIFYGVYPGTGVGGVLPALTLKSDPCISGDGTIENPWVLG